MGSVVDSYNFDPTAPTTLLDESHPATQIALTASALDGGLVNFEFLPSATTSQTFTEQTAPVSLVVPEEVPIVPSAAVSEGKAKKRSASQKSGGSTKKRRVSKNEAVEDKPEQGSPALSPKTVAIEPPVPVSPSSSLSGHTDRKMAVAPPLSAHSPMPVFPTVTGNTKPLLPKPSPEATKAAISAAPSPATAPAPATTTSSNSKTPSTEPLVLPDAPPNITTEHIHMLTSENGPAECAKAVVTVTTGVDGRRVSKSHLSQEQRAQASRDRNREHARNTRLRKKAYIEELKRTLMALCDQRDANALEERRKKKLEEQHRNVRFSVLEEFLRLRGNNVSELVRWSAILIPGFTLRLPTINAQEQVEDKDLSGVTQVMDESSAFSAFLQTFGNGLSPVTIQYSINRSDLFMDGNNAVLEWSASSQGAVANGARDEIKFHGNIKAKFDPESNRIVSASIMFDSGIVLAQKKSVTSS